MKKKESKNGFTIIEASLVLAIAGLIFLMVFVALPALQRSQRDARRRDDVGKLLTAIQKYQSNNRGALPDNNNVGSSLKSFLGDNFEDPAGKPYKLEMVDCGTKTTGEACSKGNKVNNTGAAIDYTMYIVSGATCDASKAVASNNPRKVAVLYKMEGAGAYCANM